MSTLRVPGLHSIPAVVIAVAIVSSAVLASDGGPKQIFDRDLSVDRVAPGVWRHRSVREVEHYGRVPANGLIVIGGTVAALIDTPWTEQQTGQLFDWVQTRFGVELMHVVVTHSHGDCTGGLAEAHRRGARSYALDLTAELARDAEAPLPQQTFTERHRIDLGGMALELRYFGAGHTRDNIVVWISARNLLFGGCLIKREGGSVGYIDEADLEAWPDTVRTVLEAFPQAEIVVPGHGSPGTLDYLHYTIRLIEALGQ